jgi:hypothetical protein
VEEEETKEKEKEIYREEELKIRRKNEKIKKR